LANDGKRNKRHSQRTGRKPPPIEDSEERQSQEVPPAAGEPAQLSPSVSTEAVVTRIVLPTPVKPEIASAREALQARRKLRLSCPH